MTFGTSGYALLQVTIVRGDWFSLAERRNRSTRRVTHVLEKASSDRRLGSFVWPSLFLVIVAGDQVSKALVSRSEVRLDPGTGTLWPWVVSSAFKSPTGGDVLDYLSVVLLVALTWFAWRRARRPLTSAGATVLLAGLSSNLLDRLGMDVLTQGVHGRFVVNWFDVGLWRIYVGNVADCCYVVGSLLLFAAACAWAAASVRQSLLERARLSAVALRGKADWPLTLPGTVEAPVKSTAERSDRGLAA